MVTYTLLFKTIQSPMILLFIYFFKEAIGPHFHTLDHMEIEEFAISKL